MLTHVKFVPGLDEYSAEPLLIKQFKKLPLGLEKLITFRIVKYFLFKEGKLTSSFSPNRIKILIMYGICWKIVN